MVRLPPVHGGAIESYILDILNVCNAESGIQTVLIGDADRETLRLRCRVIPVNSPIDRFPLQVVVSPLAHLVGGGLVGRRLKQYTSSSGVSDGRIVHLNEEISAAYFVHARRTHDPTVFSYHNPAPDLSSISMPPSERAARLAGTLLVARFISRHVSRVLVATTYLRDYLVNSAGISPDRVVRIPLPIDVDYFRADKTEPRVEADPTKVLFVGRLDSRKGILRLIKAMRDVGKEIKLSIVGKGPLEPVVRREIVRNGLHSRVSIKSNLSSDELLTEYLSSAAVIFPSSLETFGRVVVEAASCERPVVLPDIALYGDFHRGRFTVPFNLGDPQSLPHAINSIVKDQHLRQDLGRRAREYALANCSYDSFSSRLIGLYGELLNM